MHDRTERSPRAMAAAAASLAFKLALPAAMLAAGGWLAARLAGSAAEGRLRAGLEERAAAAARGADAPDAARLSFSPADEGTPAFAAVAASVSSACDGAPGSSVYTLALRNGAMVHGPSGCGAAAPAGGEYRGPAAEARLAFEAGAPLTVAPPASGARRSAVSFVPVRDQDGRTVMLVALEEPAGHWAAEAAEAGAAPLKAMLWLALVPALGVILLYRKGAGTAAPAALALVCAVFVFWAAGPQGFTGSGRPGDARLAGLARAAWDRSQAEAVGLLRFEAAEIENKLVLRQAWMARDLDVLSAGAAQLRSSLGAGYGIDCLNYIGPDGTLLVAADGAYASGGAVYRATLRRAMAEGRDAWGLEAGPLGNFSLRYVRPLKAGGSVSGYLELGMPADILAAKVGRSLRLDLSAFARGGAVHRFHQQGALPAAATAGGSSAGSQPVSLRLAGALFSGGIVNLPSAAGTARLLALNDISRETAGASGDAVVKACSAGAFIFLALALLWPAAAARGTGAGLHSRVLRGLTQGFLLVGRDGRVAEANEAYCLMSGYSEAELKGKPLAELELPKKGRARDGGETSLHRRKDGTVFEVRTGIRWINEYGGWFAALVERLAARPAAAPARVPQVGEGELVPLDTIIAESGVVLPPPGRQAEPPLNAAPARPQPRFTSLPAPAGIPPGVNAAARAAARAERAKVFTGPG